MLIGILGDSHDHLENIRRAVELFNSRGCGRVIHAGDIVSPIALPPFRKLRCPMLAVYGDNDGNRSGVAAGFAVLGELKDPPVAMQTEDGRYIVVTHRKEDLRRAMPTPYPPQSPALVRAAPDSASADRSHATQKRIEPLATDSSEGAPIVASAPPDLIVFSHTHRPYLARRGSTLWLNPGEACGWVSGHATVALYDSQTGEGEIIELADG